LAARAAVAAAAVVLPTPPFPVNSRIRTQGSWTWWMRAPAAYRRSAR
jgi:hypothetical protein